MKKNQTTPTKKTPKETSKTIPLSTVTAVFEDLQRLVLMLAAKEADTHNRLEGLVVNKIIVNNNIDDLNQRVQELEDQVRIFKAQNDFQKVPDLLDKLAKNSKGLKDEIAAVQRCTHQGNDTKKPS